MFLLKYDWFSALHDLILTRKANICLKACDFVIELSLLSWIMYFKRYWLIFKDNFRSNGNFYWIFNGVNYFDFNGFSWSRIRLICNYFFFLENKEHCNILKKPYLRNVIEIFCTCISLIWFDWYITCTVNLFSLRAMN